MLFVGGNDAELQMLAAACLDINWFNTGHGSDWWDCPVCEQNLQL